jgi:hypothetical protein
MKTVLSREVKYQASSHSVAAQWQPCHMLCPKVANEQHSVEVLLENSALVDRQIITQVNIHPLNS